MYQELHLSTVFRGKVPRAILHNPALYPDPETFRPERFLNEDGTFQDDPAISLAFGAGKRICPGRHLVDATLFIVTACLLSVFNVTKARDEHGHEIPVSPMVQADSILMCGSPRRRQYLYALLSGPLQPSCEVRLFHHSKRQGRRRFDRGKCCTIASCYVLPTVTSAPYSWCNNTTAFTLMILPHVNSTSD